MSIFSNILGTGASEILNGVNSIIGKFKISPVEKESFKLQLESLLQKRDQEIEETYRQEILAKSEVIKAELAQGDNFTKRARPSVVYLGLIFIFLVHVLLPIVSHLSGKAVPDISLPEEFWWAWGSVVSVYGIGRSFEKTGVRNRLTGIITGSGADKVEEAKG
ncbi:holin family protein [Reichenbachiella sp. MALMAid0571]|uniref:holin family protein n=1 Tax=Reichenbachiella sp. MALMAid0571 TaxID=3143939 RepID=UPI0032DE5EB3